MTRRTLLKLATLLPFAGPLIAKVLAQTPYKPTAPFVPFLPAHFPKWDKAVDGLESAAKWAMDIEWLRIPANLMLPEEGEIWRAVADCEVPFQASINHKSIPPKMFSDLSREDVNILLGFGTAQLRAGEKVRILQSGPKPITVKFIPVRYDELHEKIVPQKIRSRPGYAGYTLHLKTVKTVSDFCQAGAPDHTFFTQAFRRVSIPGICC